MKTITFRVHENELKMINELKNQHFKNYKVNISTTQMLKNLITDKYEKVDFWSEKKRSHEHDLKLLARLKHRNK